MRPSGEVITRFPVPVNDVATNNRPPAGPPQVNPDQDRAAADVRLVHARPSGDVITRLPVPEVAMATNNSAPSGPP